MFEIKDLKDKVKIAVGDEKNDCLFWKNLMKRDKKKKNFQSIFRVGVCALHTLGRHVVKHG